MYKMRSKRKKKTKKKTASSETEEVLFTESVPDTEQERERGEREDTREGEVKATRTPSDQLLSEFFTNKVSKDRLMRHILK